MKNGELKRKITEYLARDISEFKEKDDQGEGYFVTHLVKSSRVRAIIDDMINIKRQTIETTMMTSDKRMAEIVCLHICKKLICERERECLDNSFINGKIDVKTATDFLNYTFTVLGLGVTLDGRNVIDEYYRLNDSKKADDTISMLELHIPRGSSNGDVFKAIFPYDYIVTDPYVTCARHGAKTKADNDWWNAPYEGVEDIDR